MDDLLKKSALAYQALMPYKYHFTLGHKGRLFTVSVHFPIEAYYHLAGLHKTGFAALANKKKALAAILSGIVTSTQFSSAGYYMEDRWEGICRLKAMIEANDAIFRYRGHAQSWSDIQADYLILDKETLFFIADGSPVSIFRHDDRKYEAGCPCLKTLMIERENISDGVRETIFRSPSFRDQKNEQ